MVPFSIRGAIRILAGSKTVSAVNKLVVEEIGDHQFDPLEPFYDQGLSRSGFSLNQDVESGFTFEIAMTEWHRNRGLVDGFIYALWQDGDWVYGIRLEQGSLLAVEMDLSSRLHFVAWEELVPMPYLRPIL